jgi:alanine racemase
MPEAPMSWAEIDLAALRSNFRVITHHLTERAPDNPPRIIAVVKADAYGHGAPACVKVLLEEGCDFFAVASFEEALAVRRVCDENQSNAAVLILGYTHPLHAKGLAAHKLTQALLSADYAQALQKAAEAAGVTVHVHVALDSGMNRIGIPIRSPEEIQTAAKEIAGICRRKNLKMEGAFSHFAAADAPCGTAEAQFTIRQYERYDALKKQLSQKGIFIPFHHLANSAATVSQSLPELFDGVRTGILLYGVDVCGSRLPLTPVMKLKTRIMHVHSLPPGEPLGYGCSFTADTPRVIATLPIGYADGLLRKYGGARVTVSHGDTDYQAPLVGRICMDQCMLDVTDLPVTVGDEVTLFGNTPEALSRLSAAADTIEYESLCLISARLPRIYTDFEKEGTENQ